MPGVASQPTLLVKKANGTSVRMSWDEFKAYKSGLSRPNVTVVKTPDVKEDKTKIKTETKTENLPMKEPVMPVPVTTAPVKKIFEDMSQKSIKSIKSPTIPPRQWTPDDHRSPLDEQVVGARKQDVIRTTLPAGRDDVFDQVIRQLKFPVRDDLRQRLKSLIVSRVKDIRNDDQVGEYAMRPVEKGGLGLTEAQVGELLGLVNMKTSASSADRLKHENIKTQNTNNITQVAGGKQQMAENRLQATGYRLQVGGEKPILHDVVAPVAQPVEQKVGVGPMEEFSTFEIKDFRRLGQPALASDALIKKFATLREEALILYLRAVKAWRQSPLYRQYQQAIVNAINQNQPIKEVVGAVGLKWEEFEAITKVCSSL